MEGGGPATARAAPKLPARCQLGEREAGAHNLVGQCGARPRPPPRWIGRWRALARSPFPRRPSRGGQAGSEVSASPRPSVPQAPPSSRLPPPPHPSALSKRRTSARAAQPRPPPRGPETSGRRRRRPRPPLCCLAARRARLASRPRPASSASGVGSRAEAERARGAAGGWRRGSVSSSVGGGWAPAGPAPPPRALPPAAAAGPRLSLKAAGLRPAAAAGGERGATPQPSGGHSWKNRPSRSSPLRLRPAFSPLPPPHPPPPPPPSPPP